MSGTHIETIDPGPSRRPEGVAGAGEGRILPPFLRREATLRTMLLAPRRHPAADLAQLFADRWRIEGNFDHLTTTMGAAVLRCKGVDVVTKDHWAFVRAFNLIRQVMPEAARRQEVESRRVSFVDALRWLAAARAGADLGTLVVIPQRESRTEPRVIKRRTNQYPLMTRPRKILRQELIGSAFAA